MMSDVLEVRNKTIIGLKFTTVLKCVPKEVVRNKTIIGLKWV